MVAADAAMAGLDPAASAGRCRERDPVLLLDEVAQLGRMQVFEEATTIMRGYGVRLWFIFQ